MSKTVKVFKMHPSAVVPEIQSNEAAGFDICCIEDFSISSGERVVVRTGLVMQPPEGYHMELIIRSGMAWKHGIMLTNNVGVIDRDYAGPEDEIKLMLFKVPEFTKTKNSTRGITMDVYIPENDRQEVVKFKAGDRIAQVLFRKTESFKFEQIPEAPKSDDRGGLGSTGK